MQFHWRSFNCLIVIHNKVKSCFRNTQNQSPRVFAQPAHGFAVTMITILPVVCAAYEKTAEAARSEFNRAGKESFSSPMVTVKGKLISERVTDQIREDFGLSWSQNENANGLAISGNLQTRSKQ